MQMNRRTVLIGVGGVVAGGGALLGSGAFSQVEADRTVTIETAGDDAAFLALEAADGDYDEFFDYDDGVLELNIGELGDAEGLNENAVTAFDGIIAITNNGTQEVELSIEQDGDGVALYEGDFEGSDDTTPLDGVTIGDGDTENIGIAVDTGFEGSFPDGTIDDGESVELTITAEATT